MKVLLLGSGGREYTFCHQLAKSPHKPKLFIAPGNAGTAHFGTNIEVSPTDFEGLKQAVSIHEIEMVIVGPEVPLVEGVADFFATDQALAHIPVIGPSKQGAKLEGSKEFAKAFMQRHNIPTAAYKSFTKDTLAEGLAYLETATMVETERLSIDNFMLSSFPEAVACNNSNKSFWIRGKTT